MAETLREAAAAVLRAAEMKDKVRLTLALGDAVRAAQANGEGDAQAVNDAAPTAVPDRPARPAGLTVVAARDVARRGMGTLANRVAMLHSLAHIESWAIDLAVDHAARFGHLFPAAYTHDWLIAAEDEARHFSMLNDRLVELGSAYGELPVHDNLWASAADTADSAKARLAIMAVHEARGLDVTPNTIEKFRRAGDAESVAMLEVILEEEISHVAAGVRWFSHLASNEGKDPESEFRAVVKEHFRGPLKGPFNVDGRSRAGMDKGWYDWRE